MRSLILFLFVLSLNGLAQAQPFRPTAKAVRFVDSLLAQMTLEEKLGQVQQVSHSTIKTGPVNTSAPTGKLQDQVANLKLGSVLNCWGAAATRELQQANLARTRLKIPLLFGADVIHGFRTMFPIPIAEACSWDPALAERSARIAAKEAAAAGLHWTFAPMVDIARDARWGRVAEGAGEDPYLGTLFAAARVRGFQGRALNDKESIAACLKHFVGYGAAEAGREYNTTDISERVLREFYLPPFKAGVDAGALTLMSAFNELNGVPASANRQYLRGVLRDEWKFSGMVVSDWASVYEQLIHGTAQDEAEAARRALAAGVDMEMVSTCYRTTLPKQITEGRVPQAELDNAVRNILHAKYALGLFANPYARGSEAQEKKLFLSAEHRAAARDAASKSIVLLQNEGNLLPLKPKAGQKIAIIGPLADAAAEMKGTWALMADPPTSVSYLAGMRAGLPQGTEILYHPGCKIDSSEQSFEGALAVARQADVIVFAAGEGVWMSGEAGSRLSLDLPGAQPKLAAALSSLGKPSVLLVTSGRPLVLTSYQKQFSAVVQAWCLGSEAGNAVADVLFGRYNPSGRLVSSFPYHQGQTPIYYNVKNTGRPFEGKRGYISYYLDGPTKPLYPFGYGLSYHSSTVSGPQLADTTLGMSISGDSIVVRCTVKNSSGIAGTETVQLYVRDLVASGVGRPIAELKGFRQVQLKGGEQRELRFALRAQDLSFWRENNTWGTEPGRFAVMVGLNSRDVQTAYFRVEP